MSIRSYLPATSEALRALADGGVWELPAGFDAVVAEGDDEEHEYAALMTAADSSTRLALEHGVVGLRRVVVVVEADRVPEPGSRVGLVEVAALHVDTDDRTAESDPDDDLAWFALQELSHLVGDD